MILLTANVVICFPELTSLLHVVVRNRCREGDARAVEGVFSPLVDYTSVDNA